MHNTQVEDIYSVVCSEVTQSGKHQTIQIDIHDNVGVTAMTINGVDVTNKLNQGSTETDIITSTVDVVVPGTTTNKPTEAKFVTSANGHFYIHPPLLNECEYDNSDKNNISVEYLIYRVYTITASDAAGNTFTRSITLFYEHEWEMENGQYVVTPASEPTDTQYGLLPHVNCKHCARYILVKKSGNWKKYDLENSTDLAEIALPVGCVLVRNAEDIFAGKASINEALTAAKDVYYQAGTADDPIGIATIIKLTPNTVGAKVDADPTVASLVNPLRPLILDLNGQSIDKDGTAYTEVTGNANVTILLNDGNNRAAELTTDNVPYRNISPVSGSPIQYKRTFSSTQGGKWQALYLPFEAVRPADTKVGTVAKVEIDTSAKLWISQWADDAKDNLQAFTPYFIQHAAGEMVITGTASLEGYKKDAPATIPGSNYTIAGSLTSSDRVAQAAKNFWSLTNGGGFTWVKVGVGQRPYRWVIYGDPAVDTSNVAPSKALSFFVVEPSTSEVTAITPDQLPGDIYTVTGIRMPRNARLPQGLYISNGKKFYVK